ncbi:hypothetical protein MTE1_3646 [Klebsiella pneumoniae JHCK1]|nr:hypothetical protein MTE1_3646 [Klebsiella pneumoniae JHCK1]
MVVTSGDLIRHYHAFSHHNKGRPTQVQAFFFYILRRGDENPRPGFDEWQRHPDRTKKTNLMILSHFVLQGLVKQK